jgi:hypothetical protein
MDALPDFDVIEEPSPCAPLHESWDGGIHIAEAFGNLYFYSNKAWRLALVRAILESIECGYGVLETQPPDKESLAGEPCFPSSVVFLGIEEKGRVLPKRTLPKGVLPE